MQKRKPHFVISAKMPKFATQCLKQAICIGLVAQLVRATDS